MGYLGLIMVVVLMGIIDSYVCSASIPVCITNTLSTLQASDPFTVQLCPFRNYMSSELSPGAQVYVPLDQVTPQKSALKVPCPSSSQSSRYSRKTVRTNGNGDSPRPILGTKVPFPRAILGRKEYVKCDKEYRTMNRNVHEVKRSDEKSTPTRTNSCETASNVKKCLGPISKEEPVETPVSPAMAD